MRLYLAVAVLMLAFVAYTEAQEDTLQERFTKFTEQISELSRSMRAKLNWLQERLEELKAKFGGQ
uniref:Uncharacterized protein n=1 Tax=Monopterus albus TaxID=43700 RepID=A0A3Q3JI92_MONAL